MIKMLEILSAVGRKHRHESENRPKKKLQGENQGYRSFSIQEIRG